MADLNPLIRLHKHELDEKRRVLGGLYSSMAVLECDRLALERAFELEKKAVAVTGDVHFTFAKYVERVRQQQEKLAQQEAALEKQIVLAKDSMMETFSELKKFEMTQQERDRLAAEERLFRESKEMDAIGLETFRRKGDT